MSASNPAGIHVLPKPRLILRLGGLGNQKFGKKNGVDEEPDQLEEAARNSCNEVLAEIETVLQDILKDDLNKRHHLLSGKERPWWKTPLGWLFGAPDMWEHCKRKNLEAAAFSTQEPLITVLTGNADGGDEIIRTVAATRAGIVGEIANYEHHFIDASQVGKPPIPADGLSVGTIPKSAEKRPATLDEKQQPIYAPLTRSEARDRAATARSRTLGFRAQSEALRHHSDVLLAIWDPDTEGKAGGTSETVNAALQGRIPVISIRIYGPGKADIQVLQSFEDLAKLHSSNPERQEDGSAGKSWKETLAKVLGGILKFPDSPDMTHGDHAKKHHKRSIYHPRAVFATFREGNPLKRLWLGRLWKRFDDFAKARTVRGGVIATLLGFLGMLLRWITILIPQKLVPMPPRSGADGSFEYEYGQVKKRASTGGMSGVFGDAHRGGIVASYVLAAIAVLLAVLGNSLHHSDGHPLPEWIPIVIASVEVIIITLMFALSICSSTDGWHEAWTDSRILAEALRMMEYLGPLGVHTPLPRLPYYLRGDTATQAPEAMWSVWYFRALVRMAPLTLTPPSSLKTRAQLRDDLVAEWIVKQQTHHAENTRKQEWLHHGIEKLSYLLFTAVFACALVHLVDVIVPFGIRILPIISMLVCVGGPALIASLHGFASQIEMARLRQRSSSMEKLLEERIRVLKNLDLISDPDSVEAVWGLSRESLAAASLMIDETASWSMLYKNTNITLP